MQAKVFCVYNEGAVENTPFIGAKGFSLLVEADGKKVLLDTGLRGRYLMHNLGHMHVKSDEITDIVFSHNHRSNISGLRALAESRKESIDVYHNGEYKGMTGTLINKIDAATAERVVLHGIEGPFEISEHIRVLGPFGPHNELVLVLLTKSGPVVMSSCFHCGMETVLSEVKERFGRDAYTIVGGIHFHRPNQKNVDPTAEIIKSHNIGKLYLNHCTGTGITFMRVRFGLAGVKDFYVGDRIEFEV